MLVAKPGQGSKRRASGLSERLAVEPSKEPLEIKRHCCKWVLASQYSVTGLQRRKPVGCPGVSQSAFKP
jgi:hypothetical protein